MAINILSALEIVTERIKEYINNKKVISYGEAQSLDASARTIAKNNVGVYVQDNEPIEAKDGDVWIDTDEETKSLPAVTSEDAGKVLCVAEDGSWIVQALEDMSNPNELIVNNVTFDDDAGTCTVDLATGQTEVLTFTHDDSGAVNGVTVRGRTVTLGGV